MVTFSREERTRTTADGEKQKVSKSTTKIYSSSELLQETTKLTYGPSRVVKRIPSKRKKQKLYLSTLIEDNPRADAVTT